MDKNLNKKWIFLICLILTLITFTVFCQVRTFKFITFDDPVYVTENPGIQAGLTLNAVKWAFTTGYANFWHPLTWLSLMLDWQLFGSGPAGFHLTNLLIHIANTLLLFIVLKKMTNALWQSAFVAALFALHPLHVEAVAWVAERKEVLSAFFWILTMWAYLRYVKQPNIFRYFLTMLIFALGLMAKPMLITLPFVFLLLDYWPLERIRQFDWKVSSHLILEKIPFIVLSAISSFIAFFVQRSGGAMTEFSEFGLRFRLYNALISYVKYMEKMFWPTHLAYFYPHPGENVSIRYVLISAVLLLAVTVFVLRLAKSHRYLVTGWFWYIGTLLPVIGLIQVGTHAMADRFSYITLTGLFVVIAWGLPDLLEKWPHRKIVLWMSSVIVLFILAVLTYLQLGYWKDSLTLYQHALEVTENNYSAHFGMTQPLLEQGRIEEAIWHNSEAIRIKPNYIDGFNGLGAAFCQSGKFDKAIDCYKKALQINPDASQVHANLGVALAAKGEFTEAVEQYEIALKTMDAPRTHSNYAETLFNLGKFQQSIIEYRKALLTMPNDPNILNGLGYVLAHSGKFDEAITLYDKALRISPDRIDIHLNLGTALTSSDKLDEAVKEYNKILSIQPQNAVAHNDFGVVLYRQGKLDDAISHFQQAVQINPQYTDAKNNLNAVLAEKQKLSNNAAESNKK
jgi:tetratricopeptide (TPR) repeat protein